MPRSRFQYSRWDGTQVGFDLDADRILEEMTDDLLYHGDLNAALRRMLQSGFRDRNGERLQGLRDMLEKLRRKRKDALERYDLGGVYDDIAQELRDIVDTEREALDDLAREARESGDQRRQEVTNDAVAEFTVLQNQFSAEFGHSSGGQFNTVLRGGTNQVHGLIYEYLLNRNLNAVDASFKRQGPGNPRVGYTHLYGAPGTAGVSILSR